MKLVQARLSTWDKLYLLDCPAETGDLIVVKIDNVLELARVTGQVEAAAPEGEAVFIRPAQPADYRQQPTATEQKRVWQLVAQAVKALALTMKIVDIRWSLNQEKITIAFVANGRVDFRELVRNLTGQLPVQIRLQQIGIRDQAKLIGDHGHCGRQLCCRSHLQKFSSVTGDMTEAQCLIGRGNDRLSGACGRLMCCLAYEIEGYKEALSKMPAPGSRVNVDGQRGVVTALFPLKQSVEVEFVGANKEKYRLEIDLNRHQRS